ncbi:MAG TPA: methyltransferase domain-containing protein, partial [Rhodothermales bacterium]|nr:methyltransferase domain-containing protein [Rhodothermales bacterium]
DPTDPRRRRNAESTLRALNLQDLPRWRYRIVVVEQGETPGLEAALRPFVDAYLFAYNPGPYNRGWGFNVGAVAAARGQGALCLTDADLLVPRGFLRDGLAALGEGAQALIPYTDVLYLDEGSSQRAIRDWTPQPPVDVDPASYRGRHFGGSQSQGGCVWVDAAHYESIGGHDERYQGWGAEDRAFYRRLAATAPVPRRRGWLLHLAHTHAPTGDEPARLNQQLLRATNGAAPHGPGPIGDPRRYEAARPGSDGAVPGRRPHERWHRWPAERMEGIVRRERGIDPARSARRRLADLCAGIGDRLLDVGCGPGALWTHFEPHRPRFSWAGADVTPEMLAVARRLFPYVETVHAEARALPFADGAFDVVLLRHVLEHLPVEWLPDVLREAFRVARRAVVVDFYVPPIEAGPVRTAHIGGGFLETTWTAAALAAATEGANWGLAHRFTLDRLSPEPDEVWVWTPREAPHGEPGVLPLVAEGASSPVLVTQS